MTDLSPAASESHGIRATFERWAFWLFIAVVALLCLAALIGVMLPPVVKTQPDADWGQSIVNRVIQLKDTVLDLLAAVIVATGGTMARGHMDERLKQ